MADVKPIKFGASGEIDFEEFGGSDTVPAVNLPANVAQLAGLSLVTDRLPYANGTGTLALATLTAAGRALLDDADATAQLVTLGASWQKIHEGTISSAASFTQTGLSAYRRLRVSGSFVPVTDSIDLNIQVSTDNGSSYDTGSNYRIASTIAYYSGTFNYNATAIGFIVGGLQDNAAGDGVSFAAELFDFNQARKCRALITAGGLRGDNASEHAFATSGTHTGTTARDALRLIFSSGNISTGHILVEGLV